ncbi:MAG TPA: 50S ribosomal protein L21 [Chlamydiales bacterium]|nr:50S ribosomal protein L21 [Chlamydiales bacterium]
MYKNMYAIVEIGGKQFCVENGDVIDVDLLNIEEGKPVEFSKVLLLNDGTNVKVGKPHIDNCLVKGELICETKGPKVIAYKYKKRNNYHKKIGHRQKYHRVKITEIKAG